nr:mannose-1-phosphate guanylyltransferase [Geosporobacter ferrireducens]
MNNMIAAVIMAGGKGERFWPKSRIRLPKQLISLTGEKTMIQETVDRLKTYIKQNDIYVVTGEEYASPISHQLPDVPAENIIVEPMGKNTAVCIGLTALHIARKDPEAVMIVLPSDHLIKNKENFLSILDEAASIAKQGENLVTIGITPTHPETGYGYIHFEDKIDSKFCDSVYKVKKFVEKPDKATAKKYMDSGKYLWNSGMFIWKVSTILNNIKKFMPDLYKSLMVINEAFDRDNCAQVLYEEYAKLQSVSIDYGIMEHAENIYVIPGIFGWDDVGSWTSLERIHDVDEYGNIIRGNIVHLDTKQCIIEGNRKLIATLGVEDLIIVDTEDATLICAKEKAQQVKDLLKMLKENDAEKYL